MKFKELDLTDKQRLNLRDITTRITDIVYFVEVFFSPDDDPEIKEFVSMARKFAEKTEELNK